MFNENLSRQAIAAHERSARLREARHVKKWGLLTDVVERPPNPTLEEHRARQHEAARVRMVQGRRDWAAGWCEARKRLRQMPRARAAELLAKWNSEARSRRGPDELLRFLGYHEPSHDVLEHRRQARLEDARRKIRSAVRNCTWYIAHMTCPEGDGGVAEPGLFGIRGIRCIACEQMWRTRREVADAEAAGDLRVVDCRLAEQIEML
ncbi:MAG TPA: hypothetical protein VFS20_18200 [Longimicrobium sp.]|nr:hypothetical protein [Longimicrobium sp.]